MSTLPQLNEEDIQQFSVSLRDLLKKSEARLAIVTDKAGFRLTEEGEAGDLDTTTLAALASNAFNATQAIAGMLAEAEFNSVYQQGARHSLLVQNVDESTVLIVVFPAQVSVGVVRFYIATAAEEIARQMTAARDRAPGEGLDLAMLNVASATELFRRRD